MNMKSVVIFPVFFASTISFTLFGHIDFSIYKITENEASEKIVYLASSPEKSWLAKSTYNRTYLEIGWDTIDIETNSDVPDEDQAALAGYLEGSETSSAIYDHWYNTVRVACDNDKILCDKLEKYLEANSNWINEMLLKYEQTDIYWKQVKLFFYQLRGIFEGYNRTAPFDKKLTWRDIVWMNLAWDFGDLMSALKNETNKSLLGNSHCSALIKLVEGQSDLLVAQNNWGGYETMMRIMKRYILPLRDISSKSMSFSGYPEAVMSGVRNFAFNPRYETMRRIMKKYTLPLRDISSKSMSFSSYPGVVMSGDDFYILSSGLVAQETTNGVNNNSLWAMVKPEGQVLEVIRVTVANRLATNGRSWAKIFSQYNSGTYNNQWMIVDMNKFSPRSVEPELLWVIEQIPGYIHKDDQTDTLLRQGYWASYNVPFYPDIFNMSGNQELVQKYGDFFTHDKSPRALIFKREQEKVRDIHSMMKLMRYNDYQHDPLSHCECNPPFSAENAISARCDLNPINGTYPFPALSHRSHGATDAKVTSYLMSKSLSMLAVSGPTTGTNLPPFQWSRSDYDKQLSHRGHPDLFNFQPVLITWPSLLPKITPSVVMVS